MSIIIKGMEMPKTVATIEIHPAGGYACTRYGFEIGKAIELPPHGDLVDRSKLGLTDFEIVMCDGNFKQALEMLLKKIGDAPTIIEAEGSDTDG